MRFKLFTTCFFILLSMYCIGQSSFFYTGGAHSQSVARAGTTFTGLKAIYTNPAGLAYMDGYGFDVSYDRRFNLDELSTVSVSGAKSFNGNVFGLNVSRFGFSAYNEQKVGLVYARKLSSKLAIGGALNYLAFNVNNFGNAARFTFELGVQSQLNDKLTLGAFLFGPEVVSLTESQDIPTRFSVGVAYQASQKAKVMIDVEKIVNRNPDLRIGVLYDINEVFSINSGVSIAQSSIHFGPVFKVGEKLVITGAYSFNNNLGHTTALSVSYVFDDKN